MVILLLRIFAWSTLNISLYKQSDLGYNFMVKCVFVGLQEQVQTPKLLTTFAMSSAEWLPCFPIYSAHYSVLNTVLLLTVHFTSSHTSGSLELLPVVESNI